MKNNKLRIWSTMLLWAFTLLGFFSLILIGGSFALGEGTLFKLGIVAGVLSLVVGMFKLDADRELNYRNTFGSLSRR